MHNMKILDKYDDPRDALPQIIAMLQMANFNGRSTKDIIDEMDISSDMLVQLLVIEIRRLKNNMSVCRKSAKSAIKETYSCEETEYAKQTLRDIIEIINNKDPRAWYS